MTEQNRSQFKAYVFFASSRWSKRRRVGLLRIARIYMRRPVKAKHAFLSWLIRLVTGSDIAHCAIGFDGVVLDPGIRGNRFWSIHLFCQHFPTLKHGVEVTLSRQISLSTFERDGPKKVLPTLIRWWTGGRYKTRDCVFITCDLLRSGGMPVPMRIYQPIQLLRWLKEQDGVKVVDFTDERI